MENLQTNEYWQGPEGMMDLCAGMALLSEYEPKQFKEAMQLRSEEKAEHLTACAIAILKGRNELQNWVYERWNRLYEIRKSNK